MSGNQANYTHVALRNEVHQQLKQLRLDVSARLGRNVDWNELVKTLMYHTPIEKILAGWGIHDSTDTSSHPDPLYDPEFANIDAQLTDVA